MIHLPTRLDLFRTLPPGSIGAEIGVWRGYFSSEILQLPNIAKLYMVDTWGQHGPEYASDPRSGDDHAANLAEAIKNCGDFGARAEIVQMDALKWLQAQPVDSLDFVYLDGPHDENSVLKQLIASVDVVRHGGCIMGHDYRTCPKSIQMGFGVVEAVTRFLSVAHWRITAMALDEWPSFRLQRK